MRSGTATLPRCSSAGHARAGSAESSGLPALTGGDRSGTRLSSYYGQQARRRPLPRGAAVTFRTLRRSRLLRRSYLTGFEQLTPENEMKMERLQPAPGVFRFGQADRMVRFARRYCKRIRGHTLVYGRQLPRWAVDGRFGVEELGFEMEWHVRTVVGRYAGRVSEWDAWGVGDGVSWLGPGAGGLLFDRGYRRKPAYRAVSHTLGSPAAP